MALQPDPGYYPAFSNGYFQLYQYEPFFYRFSYPPSTSVFSLSNTSWNLYGYIKRDLSGFTFTGPDGYNTISSATGETMTLVTSTGAIYSNTVFAGAGRFTDPSGNSLPSNVVLYANEPFAGISFKTVALLNPATAFVQPLLPAQLQFVGVNSNLFQLQGRPAASGGNTSYLFVASNAESQVASSTINIQINPERVRLFGGPINQTLTVDQTIAPIVFTAAPPLGSSKFFYTLPSGSGSFPSGLGFTDKFGNPVSYTFAPDLTADPSGTLILRGTPSIDSPTAIGLSGSSNVLRSTIGVQATSVFSGVLTNSTTLSFSYSPTVIFTRPTNNTYLPTLTVGLPVPTSNAYLFNAVTLFGSGTQKINSISATNLPSGLTLSTVDTFGNSYLRGTPTAASSGIYTISATDSSGNVGTIVVGITAIADVVTLTPFVDESLTFIIGRPLSNALPGYYSSNLSLTATSSAGQTLTFSYPQFSQAGITATSNVTSNGTVITFTGTPTTLVPSTFGSVSAENSIPRPYNAYAAIPILFSVVDDVFTWTEFTASFGQNQVITPIQLSATTLSGRVVVSYTVSGLPQGLICTRNGLIRGTCLGKGNGTFTATASTGISTKSRLYSYTVDPDALFVTTELASYSLTPGAPVPPIQVIAASRSGLSVTSYSLASPSYGLAIGASTGIIGGTLDSGAGLLASAPITVSTVVGIEPISSTFTLTSTTIPVNGEFAIGSNVITSLYTGKTASVIAGAGLGSPLTGGATRNPFNDCNATGPASDIQMNGSNVVASLSHVGPYGSTIFGSAIYGNGTSLPLQLSPDFPMRTFETTSPKPNVTWTLYRSAFSIAYSGSGSTWYALGQGYNEQANASSNFGQVYLIASYDNGATWTSGYYTSGTPANWALAVTDAGTLPKNPFFAATRGIDGFDRGAVVLRRSGNIYMAGGGSRIYIPDTATPSMIRITSMTGGTPPPGDNATVVPATSVPTGYFLTETRDFALGGPVWVGAGSDSNSLYYSGTPTICSTLRWSDDLGATWYASTNSSDFKYMAIAVAYGGGRWVALGQDNSTDLSARVCQLKTSTDGKTWSSAITFGIPLSITSTIAFVNSQWILNVDGSAIYINNAGLTISWSLITSPVGGVSRFSTIFDVVNPFGGDSTLTTSARDTAIQLTAPLSLNYAVMQYRYIAPIVLTLNQSPGYLFVADGSVPRGLTFDTLTGTFSGMPVLEGDTTVRVYATTGGLNYNYFDFSFEVYHPYPQKRQDTASAYTAYVRQEAIIAGAQFSRDSNALPSKNTTVGAAMGPAPPAITSAPEICCIPPPPAMEN